MNFIPCDIGLPPQFTDWRRGQLDAVNFIVDTPTRFVATCAPTGFGKCLGVGTPVLLNNGRIELVQNIRKGHLLMGPDGKPRTVVGTCSGFADLFWVKPVKGDPYRVNIDHILSLKMTGDKTRAKGDLVDISVFDYLGRSNYWKHCAKGYRVGVDFESQPVCVDPYFLGLWLGDGTQSCCSITTADREIVDYLEQFAEQRGLSLHRLLQAKGRARTYSLVEENTSRWYSNELLDEMRSLGVMDKKHIPHHYKTNSRDVRLQLLAGYLDADGHLVKKSCFDYVSESETLAMDIAYIARSLGMACYVQPCIKHDQNGTSGLYFRGIISGNTAEIPVKLPRRKADPRRQKKDVLVTGITVQDAGKGEYFGFELDGDGRFLLGDFTVTHNSLMYMSAAHLSGKRTVILTSTKGLQDQLNHDFESMSVDIRGMMNYSCSQASRFGMSVSTRVNDAPCHHGASCPLRTGGCGYFDTYRQAQEADIVVTNYQCWLYDRMKANSKQGNLQDRPVDMLVLDECHDAPDELSSFLSVTLERKECLSLGVTWPRTGYNQSEWRDWGRHWAGELENRIDSLKEQLSESGVTHALLHEIKLNKELQRKIERIAQMQDEWVIEEIDRYGDEAKTVKFDPLWPRKYAEQYLFRGIDKVVLVSATVREKTAELLGIPGDQLAFQEFPSSFPVKNRPVIHVPTVRMNFRNEADDDQMMWFLRKLDLLLAKRADRKGVIHAVSYRRARFILDNSQHKDRMIVHGSDTRAYAIDKFMKMPASSGAILVSPSVDTGYDFAYDRAEYQVIVKIPFVDTRGTVVKARCKEDKDYSAYIACQTLQQMTGRVCRAEDDHGETLVLDDNIVWFVPRYRRYLNNWWTQSFRRQNAMLPEPLPKL